MERKRCQVCDGPVVNGRCKLCVMPYRNDETLYHLNENRSDHYRHATSRARAMMRQEEIPLGDKKPGSAGTYKACAQTAAAKKNASGNKAAGNGYKQTAANKPGGYSANASRPNMGNSYGQKQTANSTYAKNYSAGGKSGTHTKASAKKKNSWLGWLIMIVVIFSVVPELWDTLRDDLAPVLEESLDGIFGSDASAVSYEMRSGDVLEVGKDLEDGIVPGYYIASCDNGFVSFMIMGEDGETGTMTVSEGLENKITLKEGDFIGIINAESEDSALLLTAR